MMISDYKSMHSSLHNEKPILHDNEKQFLTCEPKDRTSIARPGIQFYIFLSKGLNMNENGKINSLLTQIEKSGTDFLAFFVEEIASICA